MKENEKPIPYGLRLTSIQWSQELKEERETKTSWFKTCLQSMAKGT